MSEERADHVTIEVAGTLAGIPARTLRHWVRVGKLSATAGKRGKLVSIGEVERLAALVGKPIGSMSERSELSARSADHLADSLADSEPKRFGSALVGDGARHQLAAIRDEWLAPLVAQITEQAERIGRLEAEKEELRRRAEAAEAALSRRVDGQDELRNSSTGRPVDSRTQLPEEAESPKRSGDGFAARLGRWWRGEG